MTSEFSDNIGGWAAAMKKAGLLKLAVKLRQDNGEKTEILERIRLAGLPVQPSRLVNLELFLADPEKALTDFQFSLYWASLLPKDPNARKFTEVGIDRQALISFAKRNAVLRGDFDFLLNQFEENVYGGQIISDGSQVLAEMGRGKQTAVVHGQVDAKDMYIATKRPGQLAFRYSTEDLDVKRAFWKALRCLALEPDGPDGETPYRFLEGYFEFAIT
jgi:hypothetical protein